MEKGIEQTGAFKKRQAALNQIAQRRNREVVHSMAQGGNPEAIAERFAMPPHQGGFADVMADEDIFRETAIRVDEMLESGAKNNWGTYETAANEMRAKYRTIGNPPEAFVEEFERHEAVDEMAKSRLGGR